MLPSASSTPARSPRTRLWFIRAIMVAVSLTISLVAVEIGVRIALPFFDPRKQLEFRVNEQGVPLGQPNSETAISTPKGDYRVTVRFNQYGLRDEKDLARALPDDLFAVGDSFTFGWGLADGQRYSDIASARLGVPIYNIAIPGDLVDYRLLVAYAEKQGAHPRRLIVGVCMENDIMDYTHGHPQPTASARAPLKERGREFMKTHSALYLALSYTLQGKFGGNVMEKLGVARNIDELVRSNEYSERALETSRDALLELTRDRDALLVLIPSRGLWSGRNREQELRIHQRFAEMLQAAGQRVLDLRPVFESKGDPLNLYFKTDPHWNAEGHRVAGEELARRLR